MAFSKVLGSMRRYIACTECKGVILIQPGRLGDGISRDEAMPEWETKYKEPY
jgi:hypothetical protein